MQSIGEKVGFNNNSHFIRTFKEISGDIAKAVFPSVLSENRS